MDVDVTSSSDSSTISIAGSLSSVTNRDIEDVAFAVSAAIMCDF